MTIKRNPSSELISYYGSHDTSNKIRTQITWPQSVKEAVWTEIVREKINKQAEFLLERGKNTEAALLRDYVQQIQGMMPLIVKVMLQKYILTHCLAWISHGVKIARLTQH